jgi:hypothetical protein
LSLVADGGRNANRDGYRAVARRQLAGRASHCFTDRGGADGVGVAKQDGEFISSDTRDEIRLGRVL